MVLFAFIFVVFIFCYLVSHNVECIIVLKNTWQLNFISMWCAPIRGHFHWTYTHTICVLTNKLREFLYSIRDG